jgi:alkanesulfonate monooxygenase SsuD/methylene tetrahydromethanopterin reductase-like flavin-dependent oxidoreductase (luciferase family)
VQPIDALSDGRLEVGFGAGDSFAKSDFEAAGLSFPKKVVRLLSLRNTLAALEGFLEATSELSAIPIQSQVPLIIDGRSSGIRQIATELGIGGTVRVQLVRRRRSRSSRSCCRIRRCRCSFNRIRTFDG